jgi:hypothetical protein
MKVYSILLIIVFSLTTNIFSQVQFVSHTIVGGEFAALGANSVFAVDVDGDGDMDVLSASASPYGDDKIAWYENNGNENFTPHMITTSNSSGANSVYAVDVDGDGDIDVLSASGVDDKIAWYENLGVVGIEDEQTEIPLSFNLNQNYPNPFNPVTKIKFTVPSSETGHAPSVRLIIYDVLGNEIAELVNEEKPAGTFEVEWSASGVPSGVYFYQLKTEGYVETKKMILMK